MKNFDPSVIFIIFILFFAAGILRMPFLMFAAIAYIFYRATTDKQKRGDQRDFDRRRDRDRRRYDQRNSRSDYRRYSNERERNYQRPQAQPARKPKPAPTPVKRNNPFKTSGVVKFKDYDYEGAIEDFKKALEIDEKDIAVHFNIACAYSLMEDKDQAFYHLSRATELGFNDTEKIKTHDALAYIRIQDEYETFVENGYRLQPKAATTPNNSTPKIDVNNNLLEQLKQLGELRERGLLTEEEFEVQKKKLLG